MYVYMYIPLPPLHALICHAASLFFVNRCVFNRGVGTGSLALDWAGQAAAMLNLLRYQSGSCKHCNVVYLFPSGFVRLIANSLPGLSTELSVHVPSAQSCSALLKKRRAFAMHVCLSEDGEPVSLWGSNDAWAPSMTKSFLHTGPTPRGWRPQ